MTTYLKYVVRTSLRVGYFAKLHSSIPVPLNEDVGQRKGKGDRCLESHRPSCCTIQLWAETALVKLRFTVKSSRGQLPPWTILIREKGPHYKPSPMHDGHLRPGKCAHLAVSPCICKRSVVKSTTDPWAVPELWPAGHCGPSLCSGTMALWAPLAPFQQP